MTAMRINVLFAAVLLVFLAALTIGPRVEDKDQIKYCVTNIHLPGPFGLVLNCDSPQFLRHTTNFATILEATSIRQTRPGQIFVASILAKAFSPLSALIHSLVHPKATNRDIPQARLDAGLKDFIGAYIAFTVVNIVILVGAFRMFLSILRDHTTKRAAISCGILGLGLLLVFNDVVKEFLPSPHSQLLNLLAPMYCLWLVNETLSGRMLSSARTFMAAAALAALGFSAYATFAISVPFFVATAFLRFRQGHVGLSRFVGASSAFTAITLVPNTVWCLYVKTVTGHLSTVEVDQFRLFVWMLDVYEQSGAGAVLWRLVENYVRMGAGALAHIWPALLIMTLTLAVARKHGFGWSTLPRRHQDTIVSAVLVAAAMLGFYAVSGMITPRLAVSALSPAVCVAGLVTSNALEGVPAATALRVNRATLAASLVYGLWMLAKFGPYYTYGE